MGQKTNPISNRIGITRGWVSNWCGGNYAEKIAEDYKIRKYLVNRLATASISKIVIERTLKLITVTIQAARPGVIIGKGGSAVDKLKEELKKVTNKEVQINIFEVRRPEVDANIVADSIARQIEGRVSYRRAIKMAVSSAMRVGAEGIKVQISGRVGLHVFRIMMNQIGMYSVITHTIHSLRPSPTKADATIRHFTDFIMLDIDVPYISRSNGKTSPIFIAYFREIAVIDLLLCAYFPTISRIVWQMRFMGSRRKTAD